MKRAAIPRLATSQISSRPYVRPYVQRALISADVQLRYLQPRIAARFGVDQALCMAGRESGWTRSCFTEPIRMLVLATTGADIKTASKYWRYRKARSKMPIAASARSSAARSRRRSAIARSPSRLPDRVHIFRKAGDHAARRWDGFNRETHPCSIFPPFHVAWTQPNGFLYKTISKRKPRSFVSVGR